MNDLAANRRRGVWSRSFDFLSFSLLLSAFLLVVAVSCSGVETSADQATDGNEAKVLPSANRDADGEDKSLTTSVEHLGAAVESNDFCSVYEAIDIVDLANPDWSVVAAMMHSISESMIDSEDFVPDEIAKDWDSMIDGIRRIEDELEKSNFKAESIRALAVAPVLAEADKAVGQWTDKNC